jgi:hypothetical protein
LQRFLNELVDQSNLDQNPPPVIFINGRIARLDGPEEISIALCDQIRSRNNLRNLSKNPELLQKILREVSGARFTSSWLETPTGDVSLNLAKFVELIKKDESDLNETIRNLVIVFESMASLPRKPVIVIGRVV